MLASSLQNESEEVRGRLEDFFLVFFLIGDIYKTNTNTETKTNTNKKTNLIRYKLVQKRTKSPKKNKDKQTKSQDHVLSAKGLTRLT